MYGTKCFKCFGTGAMLTKRGHEAQIFYKKTLSIPIENIKVGQSILIDTHSKWAKVINIKLKEDGMISLLCNEYGFYGYKGSSVRIRHTKKEKQIKITAALEYQSTLTKKGTIKKDKKMFNQGV